MAAAKKAARKKTTAKATATEEAAPEISIEEIRIKYDPVMVALSKAEAARLLLVNAGDFFENEQDLDWIEEFADDALVEALAAAKAAYVKAVGDKTVGNKPAPAAEAAR